MSSVPGTFRALPNSARLTDPHHRFRSLVVEVLVRIREAINAASTNCKSDGCDDSADALRSEGVVCLAFEAIHMIASIPLLASIPSLSDLIHNIIRILDAAVYKQGQYRPSPNTARRETFYSLYYATIHKEQVILQHENKLQIRNEKLTCEIEALQARIRRFEEEAQLGTVATRALKLEAIKSNKAIEVLQNQVASLKDEIESLRANKLDLERSLFEAELESIERQRVADQAVAEYQRIVLEHNLQQRLLAEVDFNPARLTRAPQRSTAIDPGDNDDSLRNELDTAYHERDLLLEQLEVMTKDRDQMNALYRKENRSKNATLLRLAQVKDEYADLQNRYHEALESRTPRPDWDHVCDRFDATCRICVRHDLRAPSSTIPSARKVLQLMATLQERTSELDEIRRRAALESENDESIHFDIRSSCRWTSRDLFAYDSAQDADAKSKVPSWLRAPIADGSPIRFRNRNFTLKTILKMIRDIWDVHDPAVLDVNDTLTRYFESRSSGNPTEALELAYNFADGLDRHRWIYECHLLREVIRGRLHWRCSSLTDKAQESLTNAMMQVDRRVRGKLSNKVAKGLFLDQCRFVFPNKTEEARTAYAKALQRSGTGNGFLIEYRSLLQKTAINDFMETIRSQLLSDLLDYQRALFTALQQRTDSDGGVTLQSVLDALESTGTEFEAQTVHDLFGKLQSQAAATAVSGDGGDPVSGTVNVIVILRQLNLQMLLYPRNLFVAVAAPADVATSERSLGRSSSHLPRKPNSLRLGMSLSGSKSATALPEKIESEDEGNDTDSTMSKTPDLSRGPASPAASDHSSLMSEDGVRSGLHSKRPSISKESDYSGSGQRSRRASVNVNMEILEDEGRSGLHSKRASISQEAELASNRSDYTGNGQGSRRASVNVSIDRTTDPSLETSSKPSESVGNGQRSRRASINVNIEKVNDTSSDLSPKTGSRPRSRRASLNINIDKGNNSPTD